jgi:hypothetical protein
VAKVDTANDSENLRQKDNIIIIIFMTHYHNHNDTIQITFPTDMFCVQI